MKLLKEENEKVIVVIKDELSGKVMKNVVGLRAKSTEKFFIKIKCKFEDYKNC